MAKAKNNAAPPARFWGPYAVAVAAITALGLWLRSRALAHMSPTFDEPFHLFQAVFYAQKGFWQQMDSSPPLLQWILAKVSPWIASFRDVEKFIENESWYFGPFVYRIDEFSGVPGDGAIQNARLFFQVFWIATVSGLLILGRRMGMGRWSLLTLYAFLMLEPSLIGLGVIVKHDIPTLAFCTWGTLLALATNPLAWIGSALLFAAGWATKLSTCFWIVPLLLGLAYKKLPPRSAVLWAAAAVGGVLIGREIGYTRGMSGSTDPSFRETYLDGVIYNRTPTVYFLQALLCKSSLAVFLAAALSWARDRRIGRLAGYPFVAAVFVLSLLGSSFILPGLGVRLVVSIFATLLFVLSYRVETPKLALGIAALLAIESVVFRDELLGYQNPLAGREPRLLDSNTDWGQGLKDFIEWRNTHAPKVPVALSLFGATLPEIYGFTDYKALRSYFDLPLASPLTGGEFRGYVVMSEGFKRGYFLRDPNLLAMRQFPVVKCFQRALCVYDVTKAPQ